MSNDLGHVDWYNQLCLDAIVQCTRIDCTMIDTRDDRDNVVLNNTNVLIILLQCNQINVDQSDGQLIDYTRGAERCCLDGVKHQSSST